MEMAQTFHTVIMTGIREDITDPTVHHKEEVSTIFTNVSLSTN